MLSSEQDRNQSLTGRKSPREHAQGHAAAGLGHKNQMGC